MLLSHCPNCQHDNPPGERFCAACGVPLDLKPCPVCGKVDNIKATVCSGCGAHFPPLPGPLSVETATPDRPHAKPAPPVVTPPTTTMRALPLIVVALAAGGIPLLWLYRNTMPVPKAWQAPTGSQVAVPAPTPPVRLEPVPPPQPPKAAPAPAVEEAAPPAPAPKPVAKAGAARPAAKAAAKASDKIAPEPPPAQPAKANQGAECTEALAAVGLCDPKAGK
jgi:hypothetical protein